MDCTTGSTDYDSNIIDEDTTYILTSNEYMVECNGRANIVAWEFCYQKVQIQSNFTFYPGIWKRNTGRARANSYTLIKSSMVTFIPTESLSSCQMFNLQSSEQFTVQQSSYIGLYSNTGSASPPLFTDSSEGGTYKFSGKPSMVDVSDDDEEFNIAISVHISE